LVIWNNRESSVLMNGSVMCVEDESKNNECMHVKCKSIIIMWNNFVGIQFHFYHKSILANGGWLRKNLKILLGQMKKWVALVWAYFVQFLPLFVLTGKFVLKCISSWQLIIIAFCIWHLCFGGVLLSKIYTFQCRFRFFLLHYCKKYY
jgi:hypothetical protein